jgi:hypothetical protein
LQQIEIEVFVVEDQALPVPLEDFLLTHLCTILLHIIVFVVKVSIE